MTIEKSSDLSRREFYMFVATVVLMGVAAGLYWVSGV